ncbi:MAG: hypothetical protein JSV81_03990 [Anaerolineales bacterium]|nr:MAG: hypothetical protein JSV81_03990 [Anaerolineales bacterium]
MPRPHLAVLDELADMHNCNRSEIVRRLIVAIASGAIPPEFLEASHSQALDQSLRRREASHSHPPATTSQSTPPPPSDEPS